MYLENNFWGRQVFFNEHAATKIKGSSMLDPLNASYPVLTLRDIVVFPFMIVPLFVGREKSVRALEEVMQDDKQILLSSQKDPAEDDPDKDGIFSVGVLANVLQLLKLPDGTVKVLVEGQSRVKITEYLDYLCLNLKKD